MRVTGAVGAFPLFVVQPLLGRLQQRRDPGFRPWTDDYGNLLLLLRRRG